jgi:hypothetical protein
MLVIALKPMTDALVQLAVSSARAAMAAGNAMTAWEWLLSIKERQRPPDLVAECLDALSRQAASDGNWGRAAQFAEDAVAIQSTSVRQERLGLLRRRTPLQGDREWEAMKRVVPTPERLRRDALEPEVSEVRACGAYFSRGAGSGEPWSRYLRLSKAPPVENEERQAIFSLARGYFARFIAQETDLLVSAEVVVPVPANPHRYTNRMASLPDELARAAEACLALPMLANALSWVPSMTEIEMKQVPRNERRRLARAAFQLGDQAEHVSGRSVLLVDDVTTSGSTLRACASKLRDVGANAVVACCLAHTEG